MCVCCLTFKAIRIVFIKKNGIEANILKVCVLVLLVPTSIIIVIKKNHKV